MKDLFGKLADMSYEFVGVIVPGFVLCVFLSIWWLMLGGAASTQLLDTLNLETFDALLKSLSSTTVFVLSVFALLLFYIVGQMLVEYSRKGKAWGKHDEKGKQEDHQKDDEKAKVEDSIRKFWRRWLSLRVPTPSWNYAPSQLQMFEASWKKLSIDTTTLDWKSNAEVYWKEFYNIARSLVDERLKHSLVTSYQNKYTLHRSIACAAAIVFWLSIVTLDCWIMGGSSLWTPNALGLFFIALITLGLRHSFVSSFEFHWTNFGTTLIAETYALLFGPKEPAAKDDQPEGD